MSLDFNWAILLAVSNMVGQWSGEETGNNYLIGGIPAEQKKEETEQMPGFLSKLPVCADSFLLSHQMLGPFSSVK